MAGSAAAMPEPARSLAFRGKGVLLDIEGTTSSISYVFDVLFPYAREHLRHFLEASWDSDETRAACERVVADAEAAASAGDEGGDGTALREMWTRLSEPADRDACIELIRVEVIRLMDGDVKATGLKQLQGLIWREGFLSGELRAHTYDDVPAALERWRGAGIDVRIYSSGSVEAQRLFFGHTEAGDLLANFSGHHDTRVGAKREVSSYRAIVADWGLDASEVLFVSDVVAELDAAAVAGMKTALAVRPGNPPQEAGTHPVIGSFEEIRLD